MVSTQLASSTLAAVEVLKTGGNAVDAALTALFVQQVHDYHMVFLFGSMPTSKRAKLSPYMKEVTIAPSSAARIAGPK